MRSIGYCSVEWQTTDSVTVAVDRVMKLLHGVHFVWLALVETQTLRLEVINYNNILVGELDAFVGTYGLERSF